MGVPGFSGGAGLSYVGAYVANYERQSFCTRPRDLHLDLPSRTVTCRNLNGATGDIAPIYSVYDDFKRVRITEFNVLLGDRILQALDGLRRGGRPPRRRRTRNRRASTTNPADRDRPRGSRRRRS